MAGNPWVLREEVHKGPNSSSYREYRYPTKKALMEAVERKGVQVVRENKYTFRIVKKSVPTKRPSNAKIVVRKGKVVRNRYS